VRKAPFAKPDQYLRFLCLESVCERVKNLLATILFDPRPLLHKIPRQRCFCRRKSDHNMVLCDGCDEWYHLDCVGMNREEANAAQDWMCGYCRSAPDGDGNRDWKLEIPQGNLKRKKVAKPRNDRDSPKARGIPSEGSDFVDVGPVDWDDCVQLAQAGRKKIREADQRFKRKAAKIVKEGGHHVVDQMSLNGVERQGVSNALVADLIAVGEIDEEEEDHENSQDDNADE
jgi:hypothetical protein